MSPYFKPLRRKLGVAMLALSCLLAAGWVRSLSDMDQFQIFSCRIRSADGEISMFRTEVVFQRIAVSDRLRSFIRFVEYWKLPYWTIVTPLTLISVWLLLGKPREKKRLEEPG